MDLLTLALAVAAAAALGALAAMRWERGRSAGTVAEDVRELRTRLDALVSAQAAVPAAVADGAAAHARALADLREQLANLAARTEGLDALGDAVGDLQRLLTVPQLRGALGELWLEELLRDALPPEHWAVQHAFRSGERVDAVIRLRDRLVPVDAKFPLEAWRRVLNSTGTDAERETRAFLRSVRARVDEIATRYVRPDEGTTDFAIMYVPAEGVFYEALLREPAGDGERVLDYARRRRVLIASPHSFWAYLGAVALGLRGAALERHQQALLDQLAALGREVSAFFDAFDTARRHLANAERQFADAERLGYRVQDRMGALVAGRITAEAGVERTAGR